MSMPSCTSPRVSIRILPISRVIDRANSSLRARMISPARKTISARLGAGVNRHIPKAAAAASTASFTSPGPDDGNSPKRWPFAGLRLEKVRPERALPQRPPM
jgi:hypothetical protein